MSRYHGIYIESNGARAMTVFASVHEFQDAKLRLLRDAGYKLGDQDPGDQWREFLKSKQDTGHFLAFSFDSLPVKGSPVNWRCE